MSQEETNNNNQQQEKPDFQQEFLEKVEQKNQQPSQGQRGTDTNGKPIVLTNYQYDAQGNRLPPQTDSLGNPNKSRGIIGQPTNQQQNNNNIPQFSDFDRPKWDKTNPPINQTQPVAQKFNPTTPEELQKILEEQKNSQSRNLEAAAEREKALKLQIQNQGHTYVAPDHLKDHPYLAPYINQTPVGQQQNQSTEQKLEQGEEVISIDDQQPIQSFQIRNGVGGNNNNNNDQGQQIEEIPPAQSEQQQENQTS